MDAVALQHQKSYTSYSSEIVLTGQTRQSRTAGAARSLRLFPHRTADGHRRPQRLRQEHAFEAAGRKEQPDAGQIEMPQGWHSALLSPDPYVITWTNVQRNVAIACGVGKTPESAMKRPPISCASSGCRTLPTSPRRSFPQA